jgi:hypothetical protein
MGATCPAHLILLHLITLTNNIRWIIQAVKFIIMQFSPRSVSFLLGPNILLNTLFSKTLSLCSSPKVRDQVSHPYSTIGKITLSYIFRFFDMRRKKRFSPHLIYSWFHHECHSDLLVSSPSIWILPHFQTIQATAPLNDKGKVVPVLN